MILKILDNLFPEQYLGGNMHGTIQNQLQNVLYPFFQARPHFFRGQEVLPQWLLYSGTVN